MAKTGSILARVIMICIAAFLAGCDERSAITATPSPVPPEINTVAPTPTLASTETSAGATATATVTGSAPATATATLAQAQGIERRISFAAGASSATVENAVVSGTRDRYILEAQAGQTMRVEISSLEDNAEFQVFAPDGQHLEADPDGSNGVWEQELSQSGDYEIVVGPTRGNATYQMVVTIPPAAGEPTTAPPPDAEATPPDTEATPPDTEATRISFAPGMAATTVEGSLEAGGRSLYVFEAVENQDMVVGVRTPGEPVVLGVRGADGTVFLPLEAEKTGLRIVALPATMDYFFEVVSIGAATAYQLDVGASPLADLPERVEFEAGATAAVVSGTLDMGGDLDSYILHADQGQTVIVEALPPEAPLSVYLQSEDGVDFFYAVEGRLVAELSRSLDYVLTVSTPNAAGVTNYELRIVIE